MANYLNVYSTLGFDQWIQGGFRQYKGTDCATQYDYYWEYNESQDGYNLGVVTSPSPRGTDRKFGLVQTHDGCAAGNNWCWAFTIAGTVKHRCCGEAVGFGAPTTVNTAVECYDTVSDNSCPATGEVDPYDLEYMGASDDLWHDWSGRDYACLNYGAGARGKWESGSDNAVDESFNVAISGSLTTPGC